MKIKKLGALLVSAALCVGMAAPAFAFEGEAAPVEQPVLPEVVEEDVVTITDETSGALTPEGNLTLVDDYHTNYSDGSGQQFITLVSKSGATFYLVIDRNAKGQQTVHFMNLVDEADLLALMEEEAAEAYNAEKEAAKQAGIRIQIHAGNEIYYSHDVPELLGRGEILTLAGSRYVLVEFSPTENIATVRDGLYEVMSAGYYPVLAHAERILAVAEDLRCLESLVEMGVYIQMNVKSVKSEAGFRMRRFVKEAILHDMIHFLATDAHRRDIRTPDISEDVRYIRRKFGAGFLYRTMCENPGKIIRDEVI